VVRLVLVRFSPGGSTGILAIGTGDVYYSGWDNWGHGNNLNVRIRYSDGWETWYLHLSSSAFGESGTLTQPIPVFARQYIGEVEAQVPQQYIFTLNLSITERTLLGMDKLLIIG